MPIRTRRALITPVRSESAPDEPITSPKLNKGMVTSVDPHVLPDDVLTLAVNVRVRYDKTLRRDGLTTLGDIIGEVDKQFIGFGEFKSNAGIIHLYAFTSTNVYELTESPPGTFIWTKLATGGSIAGVRVQGITFFNDFYFSNAVDPIQKVDSLAQTYDAIPGAPALKYITGFFNRIVGINREGSGADPTLVQWSADAKGDEWDPGIDQSAGSAPLIDSPSDRSDFGTGIFAFDNIIVVLRERSIWLGNKQPIAALPFNFYTQVPGQGCDAPYSAQIFRSSIFFADTRTKGIYIYQVGAREVERISLGIEDEFFRNVDNPEDIFSSIDTTNNEYIIGQKLAGTNTVRIWIFNILNQAWSYDIVEDVNALGSTEIENTALPINALVGTIDGLSGTIDELVSTISSKPNILLGGTTGLVRSYLEGQLEDADTLASTITFESNITSKDFAIFDQDEVFFKQLRVDVIALSLVELTLEYSVNGGKSWKLAKTVTFQPDQFNSQRINFKKNILSTSLRWRLTTESGLVVFRNYKITLSRSTGDTT